MPAKRGRPRKPTAAKKLHNPGRRPINDAEPEGPPIDAPPAAETPPASNVVAIDAARPKFKKTGRGEIVEVAAPSHVTGIALAKWNELAPGLANAKILTQFDLDALARYCCAHRTEVEAQNALDELQKKNPLNGLLGKTPNGMLQMNAILIVRNAAARDAAKFGSDLGLNPVARSSIKVDKPEDENEWREFA